VQLVNEKKRFGVKIRKILAGSKTLKKSLSGILAFNSFRVGDVIKSFRVGKERHLESAKQEEILKEAFSRLSKMENL